MANVLKLAEVNLAPLSPAESAPAFDEHRVGCPLVALRRSCAEMRRKRTCPHFVAARASDATGQHQPARCNHGALDTADHLSRRLAALEAAIHADADRQEQQLADLAVRLEQITTISEANAAKIERAFGLGEQSSVDAQPTRTH